MYSNKVNSLAAITVHHVLTIFYSSSQDGKTALYWAVEKGNATMVRDILQCNPDTESCTKVINWKD